MDVEVKSISASIISHVSTLQCEVWHCHAENKFYPASYEVLLRLSLIAESRDQQ